MGRPVLTDVCRAQADAPEIVEDVRSGRPYLFSGSLFKTVLRRAASVLALVAIDIGGLVLGLFAALTFRALLFDPKPILWGLLWTNEANWLAFLILLLVLVFWQAGLYAPREVREGPGRVVPAVFLTAALALAFAIGTGQHFTTFGLYIVGALFCAALIGAFRASYENLTGLALSAVGVRRRSVLVGDVDQRAHLRASLGASRGGIYYSFVAEIEPGPAVEQLLALEPLDELIVADSGLPEERLLQIVEAAHRRGVKVRVAPRTTELLIERGVYVPGQGVPLFELRPPMFGGTDWATKRAFDVAVATVLVLALLPVWLVIALLIKLTSRGPVFYADDRVGLGERPFRLFKFRTMIQGAEDRQAALEHENESTGALFKIRRDPRVTAVGRVLRRLSIDEIPNLVNVLRGEMSLVGPRPLPVRDFELLEPWHRRRYNIMPGMTGLWQVGGRSDLSFDDLVRLDFYYLENWSIWLDVTILTKMETDYINEVDPYGLEIEAVDSLRPGDVVVHSTDHAGTNAPWGELMSTVAKRNGAVGCVCDSQVRDCNRIIDMGFPVYYSGIRPLDSMGRGMVVAYDVPIRCGDVLVKPGNLIFADFDGIVVVPNEVEEAVLVKAQEKVQKENSSRKELLEGKSLREVYLKYGVL